MELALEQFLSDTTGANKPAAITKFFLEQVGKFGFRKFSYVARGQSAEATKSLREVLERLLKDPALAAAQGRRGLDRVRAHYSCDGVTDDYERLFREPGAGSR